MKRPTLSELKARHDAAHAEYLRHIYTCCHCAGDPFCETGRRLDREADLAGSAWMAAEQAERRVTA